jgi:hypothetical protein
VAHNPGCLLEIAKELFAAVEYQHYSSIQHTPACLVSYINAEMKESLTPGDHEAAQLFPGLLCLLDRAQSLWLKSCRLLMVSTLYN